MAKGRRNVPPANDATLWFLPNGGKLAESTQRPYSTSTGAMLAAPFHLSSADILPVPPKRFLAKSAINYRTSNRFSEHDNRNAFQDHGVYFGDGQDTRQLGRNLADPRLRLHNTNRDFLKHYDREEMECDYHSTYQNAFRGRDDTERPHFRRFPRSLQPAEPGHVPLTTKITGWLPTSEYRTTTQLLALSQEPFSKQNPWKYSYHSKKDVYPSYDRRSKPLIDNVFNRYGAGYTSSATFNTSGFSGVSGLSDLSTLQTTGCS